MISRFFIHRPIFATVISLVIVIAGVVSQSALPVSKFPEISPPTIQVSAVYPGANAQVVADTVAAPIEQEVNGVEGMIYMSSSSADDGSYTLTVTFEIGTDMDMANVLVQNRVSIAEPKLPEEVRRQGVTTKKKSTSIVQFITLVSPEGKQDSLQLSNYATINIKDELSRIDGVGEVMIFGSSDYSMRIWLDPRRLEAFNLTTEDVVSAIAEQNVQVAAGRLGQSPAPEGTSFELVVSTQGRLTNPKEFEQLIVKTAPGGRLTRVKDIARVELGAKDYNRFASANGAPCAAIAIYQLPGANALEVAEQVETTMDRLLGNFPDGMTYAIPFDTTLFVEASVEEVYTTLFVAVFLVVLVIYIFLQNWRATLIPCAAIPVSLIGTFACMASLGYSINMLTLFGIVLAIGIVVDDAIVVVENTSRHLDDGLGPKQAAVKAMEEITGPVIATTLVLLAVFVPTAFMGGITGQLYRQFALTISAAVLISSINALTLSPALCGILLRPAPKQQFFAFRWFNSFFDGATSVYKLLIGGMVRVVTLVVLVFTGLLIATGYGFTTLPTGFLPEEDQGYVFANIQLPDASSLQRTQAVMKKVDEVIKKTPGVKDYISIGGFSLLTGTNGSNQGFVAIVFEPWDKRQSPRESQRAILAHLAREFYQIEEAVVFPFAPPPIDGLGNAGGFQMQVQDKGNLGLAQMQQVAQEMVQAGNAQTGLQGLNTTFRATVPQVFIDIDRTKVKTLDVPLSSVFNTLQAYLGSAYVNDFNFQGRTWQVRVQADQEYRVTPEDIRKLTVRNRAGDVIPLGTLLTVEETFGPQMIQRYLLYPSAQINGQPAPGYSSGQALELMEQLADNTLPASMGHEWTGMSFQEKQVGGEQYFIFALAVLLVFLVLAAQYESWTSPAAVIAVVPLATLGVVLMLMVRGADNNTYTQIGVVLLVALASKNAILIVEFARELRAGGLGIREAAVNASQLRFRAILMTAISSILGFLPLLVASGAGAASRQAVGNSVVGGMIAATCFSLLFVPSFFVLFQALGELGGPKPEPAPATGPEPSSPPVEKNEAPPAEPEPETESEAQ